MTISGINRARLTIRGFNGSLISSGHAARALLISETQQYPSAQSNLRLRLLFGQRTLRVIRATGRARKGRFSVRENGIVPEDEMRDEVRGTGVWGASLMAREKQGWNGWRKGPREGEMPAGEDAAVLHLKPLYVLSPIISYDTAVPHCPRSALPDLHACSTRAEKGRGPHTMSAGAMCTVA